LFSSAQRDKVLLDFKSGIWYFDRAMAKIDRLKEEIGWLKLVFGLLVAIDVSLVGWLAGPELCGRQPAAHGRRCDRNGCGDVGSCTD